ncbi:HAMP domain-containing protein [Methanoculleus sp. FWC-SCC1]|uniref:HAMP domain-containing protein n=1 Tax=Methanoculleus frigidifontis TaxID=2584085 RepID=A0ABT8M752_9EURY|nr:SpoIIE family protein phosphatase [Methanoculleus sp. FWC-SCC1]MDN7023762.1 HAMP domain-containing protein [Methanoculleus sp. FWC-SCC1]
MRTAGRRDPEMPARSIRSVLAVSVALIIIAVVGLVLAVSYLQASGDAVRQYDTLREYTEQNGIGAVRLVDKGLALVDDDLNPPMEEGLGEFADAYRAAGGDPSAIDLAALRDELAPAFPGDLDLYIIDADGTIRFSTVPDVIGVDFRQFPAFYSRLTAIREGDAFAADRVVRSIEDAGDLNVSGRLRKFAYLPTPDHRYVLELGIDAPEFADVRSHLSYADTVRTLLQNNPDLAAVSIIDVYGNVVAGTGVGEIAGAGVMDVLADRTSATSEDPAGRTTTRRVFVDLHDPAAVTDGSVVLELVFDHSRIDAIGQHLLVLYSVIGLAAALLGIGLAVWLSRSVGAAVGAVIDDADRIAGGDLDHTVRGLNTTEFVRLGGSINRMVQRIREYSEEIERKESELRIAADIQTAFLPRSVPQPRGCEVAAFTLPAKEVGGDFYDFFGQGEGRCALVIADVAGKGVPAALYMALSRTAVRTVARWCRVPAETIRRANNTVIEDAGSVSFVTLFYAVVDERARTLTYVNAGHNPPILRRADGTYETLEPTGPVIGFLEDMDYGEVTLPLLPGDLLVLYTDGVTEAESESGGMLGEDRLRAVVEEAADLSAGAVADAIRDAVAAFAGEAPQFDDITVVVLRVIE